MYLQNCCLKNRVLSMCLDYVTEMLILLSVVSLNCSVLFRRTVDRVTKCILPACCTVWHAVLRDHLAVQTSGDVLDTVMFPLN